MNPNWELSNCCQHEQVVFLATIGVFTLVILALWRTFLLTPFKLITVFLHEASHAIACKLTCGEVEGIQVHANEGGVTQTRGDLGSSFWGMALILASTNLLTARIAAGCLILSLLIVLFIAKNWTLRGLCIGVMNSLFSVYDIYDDLISRRVHSSDAEKFAELCPCPCNGVAWGVICSVFCLLIAVVVLHAALLTPGRTWFVFTEDSEKEISSLSFHFSRSSLDTFVYRQTLH
ncbi:hypothetical protein DH2020_037494 [Rehmannia glutinosa]|uniref:Peptidase M50B-like protein n=1 Tax=Rehmannia glutinosa TaxID=99300 RepID=A0ABR0V2R6_REHGL